MRLQNKSEIQLFDRLDSGRPCKSLPSQCELGRYYLVDADGKHVELTSFVVDPALISLQERLIMVDQDDTAPDNEIIRGIRRAMLENVDSAYPLVNDTSATENMTDFECQLYEQIVHFKCIFRQPYAQLNHIEEKVNVARAKRIPNRGFQHLSSHTEDWMHRSVVSFHPSRIIHEELDENFDVIENRLLYAFVERAIKRVRSHYKRALDNQKLLASDVRDGRWSELNDRTFRLAGKATKGRSSGNNQETALKLSEILQVMMGYYKSELNDGVNKAIARRAKWQNTNCLTGDRHYRCLGPLWRTLHSTDEVITHEMAERIANESLVALRFYAECVILYALTQSFRNNRGRDNYQLVDGDAMGWTVMHNVFPTIRGKWSKQDTLMLYITIADEEICCAEVSVIGHPINLTPNINERLLANPKLYIMSYVGGFDDTDATILHERIIPVNAYQTNSVERTMQKLIMPILLRAQLSMFYKKDSVYCPVCEKKYRHLYEEPFFRCDCGSTVDAKGERVEMKVSKEEYEGIANLEEYFGSDYVNTFK